MARRQVRDRRHASETAAFPPRRDRRPRGHDLLEDHLLERQRPDVHERVVVDFDNFFADSAIII